MEANVAPVSKLDVLLTLDHSLDVQLAADGSATEKLVTTYTNHYGPTLPPELERVRSTFADGILGSYSRRYLVPDADTDRRQQRRPRRAGHRSGRGGPRVGLPGDRQLPVRASRHRAPDDGVRRSAVSSSPPRPGRGAPTGSTSASRRGGTPTP